MNGKSIFSSEKLHETESSNIKRYSDKAHNLESASIAKKNFSLLSWKDENQIQQKILEYPIFIEEKKNHKTFYDIFPSNFLKLFYLELCWMFCIAS